MLTWLVVAVSLICLGTLGAIASRAGGAKAWVGALRVTFWGALAMGITYGVGVLFKVNV
jgi:VIT1/CCC1 family predicted Fe2+/Mn2+ transporter